MDDKSPKIERLQAIYRLYRRYLMKFHPEMASLLNCEGLMKEQIIELEDNLVNWQGQQDNHIPDIVKRQTN